MSVNTGKIGECCPSTELETQRIIYKNKRLYDETTKDVYKKKWSVTLQIAVTAG